MHDVYFFTVNGEDGELKLFYPKLFIFYSPEQARETYKKFHLEDNNIVGIACFKMKYQDLLDY